MEKKTRPAHEVKLGRVRAAIWPNETKNGTRYGVTVGRLYKTEEGGWRTSTSLDLEDLLLAAKALNEADTWIREQALAKSEAGSAEEVA
jgi:hypothetical protein